MSVELLSRIQFAVTIGFHFLFPPITIGLAWLLVIVETLAWRTRLPVYDQMGRFFGKLLGLTFAVGVATGIVMEFQFGTNWARYSKFVGDVFGAPLAAEGVFAFFLESGFLGLYLFGRDRISKKWHWFAALMVAVGATLSAFWIIVANSWQQTPAGFQVANGRAELTDFYAAVFNPSTVVRYLHTVNAALVCGAFFMASAAAYLVLKNRNNDVGRRALKIAVIVGLIASVTVGFPLGHEHARQVARTQPEKFAAIEGLYASQSGAPLVMFAVPHTQDPPPHLHATIELPGFLSLLAFGDPNARIRGVDEFPPGDVPPLWLTFVSFHNMVALGMFFILAMSWGVIQLWRGKLWDSRRFLWLLVFAIPLPLAACQFGWVAAEVGRQPWIVYKAQNILIDGQLGDFAGMRTADAFSATLKPGEVLFSLILFALVYLALLALYLYLLIRKVKSGPVVDAEPTPDPLAVRV